MSNSRRAIVYLSRVVWGCSYSSSRVDYIYGGVAKFLIPGELTNPRNPQRPAPIDVQREEQEFPVPLSRFASVIRRLLPAWRPWCWKQETGMEWPGVARRGRYRLGSSYLRTQVCLGC